MLRVAFSFFMVALIAALFGFGGLAAGAVISARFIFFLFLVMCTITLVAYAFRSKKLL
ncbi:MAG: DUF1328 family protein [Saprospiraceae bacterium]